MTTSFLTSSQEVLFPFFNKVQGIFCYQWLMSDDILVIGSTVRTFTKLCWQQQPNIVQKCTSQICSLQLNTNNCLYILQNYHELSAKPDAYTMFSINQHLYGYLWGHKNPVQLESNIVLIHSCNCSKVQQCLQSFELYAVVRCCPVCRSEPYQKNSNVPVSKKFCAERWPSIFLRWYSLTYVNQFRYQQGL